MEIACPRCGYVWSYRGRSLRAKCPRCGYTFRVFNPSDGGVVDSIDRENYSSHRFSKKRLNSFDRETLDSIDVEASTRSIEKTTPQTTPQSTSQSIESKLGALLRKIVGELKELRREVNAIEKEVDRPGSDLRVLASLVGVEPRLLRSIDVVAVLDASDDAIRACVERVGGVIIASSEAGFDLDIPDDRVDDFERCLHEASAAPRKP